MNKLRFLLLALIVPMAQAQDYDLFQGLSTSSGGGVQHIFKFLGNAAQYQNGGLPGEARGDLTGLTYVGKISIENREGFSIEDPTEASFRILKFKYDETFADTYGDGFNLESLTQSFQISAADFTVLRGQFGEFRLGAGSYMNNKGVEYEMVDVESQHGLYLLNATMLLGWQISNSVSAQMRAEGLFAGIGGQTVYLDGDRSSLGMNSLQATMKLGILYEGNRIDYFIYAGYDRNTVIDQDDPTNPEPTRNLDVETFGITGGIEDRNSGIGFQVRCFDREYTTEPINVNSPGSGLRIQGITGTLNIRLAPFLSWLNSGRSNNNGCYKF